MKCVACQSELLPGSKFCENCGAALASASPADSAKEGPLPGALSPGLVLPPVVAQVGPVTVSSVVTPPPGLIPGRPEDGPQAQGMPFGTVMVNVTLPPMAPPLPPPAPERPPESEAEVKPPAVATPAPSSKPEAAPAPAGGGKSPAMLVLAVAVVVAGGAAVYLATRGGGQPTPAPAPAQAATPAAPEKAAAKAPPAAAATPQAGAKEVLNQLIAAGREDRWVEVNPTISAMKALAKPAAGDAAAASKLQQEGDAALGAGKFAEAVAAFEKARAADPASVEARLGLATAQVRAGQFEPATASLVDALVASPESGSAWLLAAENFAELDKSEASLACLKLAVYLAKDRAKALAFLQDAPSSVKSAKFKAVIAAALPALKSLPAR